MSKGTYNWAILLGHLGQDPEARVSPNGHVLVTLNLATTESRKTREGQWQDVTD